MLVQAPSTFPTPAGVQPRLLRDAFAPRAQLFFFFIGVGGIYLANFLLLLLLQAGDVETNPGPTTYTCHICHKQITRIHASIQCNTCTRWIHQKCSDLQNLQDYTNTWTCKTCPTQSTTTKIKVDSKHSLNILQLNINGIQNKTTELQHILTEHNIHIALIQETNLNSNKPSPMFHDYTTLRQNTTPSAHSILTLVHTSILFTDTTDQTKSLLEQDNTLNIQSIEVKVNHVKYNIVNIYIPPSTSRYCPRNYTPNLQPLSKLPNLLLAGDFNAHHPVWLTTQAPDQRGQELLGQLSDMNIMNNRNQPTRKPLQANQSPTSPDISFCSPQLYLRSTWQTFHSLSSDHLPILITHQVHQPISASTKHTFTNYNKANWTAFQNQVEDKIQDLSIESSSSLSHAYASFCTAILDASKAHIPQGHRKKYNHNFSPEIDSLIKQRNNLRQIKSPNQQQLEQIHNLNIQINTLISEKQRKNWDRYLTTLDHKTNSTQVWKTIKKIHSGQTQPPPSHESIRRNGKITTRKEQCNLLISHYSKISHKPTTKENRSIIRTLKKLHIDPSQPPPFTPEDTVTAIKSLKNSKATGPDNISNLHLKHLGPIAIAKLTDIFNYSWLHNDIPPAWKLAHIVPILKPNKPPTDPSSYRPISLLSTISKTFEKLLLKRISPQAPISQHQHGFRQHHSTTTLLTSLSHDIQQGFNQNPPPLRTVLVAIDLNKAFDTTPRHILIKKILQSDFNVNDKKWLANFLSNRRAKVTQYDTKSKTRRLYNGVPQGAITSPTNFNIFTHDVPTPINSKVKVYMYADDLTILAQGQTTREATTLAQQYLNELENWLTQNRMTASPQKSSVTLITPDRRESNKHPQLHLNNTTIPLNKTPTILGVTLDTHLTFSSHVEKTTAIASRKLNAIRTLTNTSFGQSKESLNILYKQFVRTTLNYAAPSWSPTISQTNLNRMEKVQNKALRINTGCTSTTPISHLQAETKILPLRNHLNMIGTQFYSRLTNPSHPQHPLTKAEPTPRHKKNDPITHYSQLLSSLPPKPEKTSLIKHIHTQFTARALASQPKNSILQNRPPEIHPSEELLSRHTRVTLARLRSGHHPSLNEYQHRINQSHMPYCSRCNNQAIDDTPHLILHCPALQQHRTQHNINSLKELWTRPQNVADFLEAAGFPQKGDWG